MKEKIAKQLTDLIGNTPLLELSRFNKIHQAGARIVAKLEYFNPAGSVKDRVALAMIEDAEAQGLLNKDTQIIEPTSGNTGIGLAFVCAAKGYKLTLTMPETMSMERRNLLQTLGANIVLTPGNEGMQGALDMANALKEQNPNTYIPQQFENKSNPKKHRETTAEEIWSDTAGKIDVLVAGVGTGGTLCGTGSRLKELNPNIKVIAVEPLESNILSGGSVGQHKIQGIGANFIPGNYDPQVVDEIIAVSSDNSILMARALAKEEGLLVGFSSGAALYAALQLSQRDEYKDKEIVAILPDSGERYLSTQLFAYEEYPLD